MLERERKTSKRCRVCSRTEPGSILGPGGGTQGAFQLVLKWTFCIDAVPALFTGPSTHFSWCQDIDRNMHTVVLRTVLCMHKENTKMGAFTLLVYVLHLCIIFCILSRWLLRLVTITSQLHRVKLWNRLKRQSAHDYLKSVYQTIPWAVTGYRNPPRS